jgi:Flp pilus assembly protein TadG
MRLRQGCGQVFPLVSILMTGLIGVTAFVVDVGAWDQNQRSMQATADAAALAGAEDLPYDQAGATALANSYAAKNGGGTATVSFPALDTIDVKMQDYGSGTFATIYGSQNTNVRITGEAVAKSGIVTAAQGVVPLVVTKNQSQLTACGAYPCFNQPATLKINDDVTLGGGQAGLIDLTGNGSVTSTQIADWVTNGLSTPLPSNAYYYSAGSCKFSNQNFHTALDAKVAAGTPLLFPVYDPSRTDTTTSPPRYYIVGFAAFVITSYRLNGCGNKSDFIGGYFVHEVTTGISDGTATADYGVRTITLTS